MYDVCFTANTSTAIKLVAESYGFRPDRGLILSADNHNSMNGMREYARAAGAPTCVLPLDDDLRLLEPAEFLTSSRDLTLAVFSAFRPNPIFPASSIRWTSSAKLRGLDYEVLIDAAGFSAAAVSVCDAIRPSSWCSPSTRSSACQRAWGARRSSRCTRQTRASVVRRRNRRFRLDRARSSSALARAMARSRMARRIF